MKKTYGIIVGLLLLVLLAGCGTKAADQKAYADNAFYASLKKGLQNRWKLTDKHEKSNKDVTASDYQGYFDAELKQIRKYKNKDFKSKKLGRLAKRYINDLHNQEKLLSDFDDNSNESVVTWDKASIARTSTLKEINDYKKLRFKSASDKRDYKSVMQALADNKDYVKTDTQMNAVVKAAKFNLSENLDGYKTYQAVIENTSKHKFTYYNIDVKLIDNRGVTVDTQTASTENWAPGSKVQFEFNTDKDFARSEFAPGDYDYND